jgi:hypothetical protein
MVDWTNLDRCSKAGGGKQAVDANGEEAGADGRLRRDADRCDRCAVRRMAVSDS